MGRTLVETYTQPGEYTGELIGVEYLFSQTGAVLEDLGRDPDAPNGLDEADVEVVDEEEQDEGFEELQDIQFLQDQQAAAAAAADDDASSDDTDPVSREESAVETGMDVAEGDGPDALGPDGRSGYQHVTALAHALVELCHHTYVTQLKAREIVALWEKLLDHDKAPVAPPRQLVTGHFRSLRSSSIAGMDSVQRSFLGKAAQSPKVSRLVEAIIMELCDVHSEGRSLGGVQDSSSPEGLQHYPGRCSQLPHADGQHLHPPLQCQPEDAMHTERSKGMSTTFLLSTVLRPGGPAAGTQDVPSQSLKGNPVLPQRPLQHPQPEDPSGLATTHRGPCMT
ncbi:uncharacterized protein LOC114850102 [Betta splendens]|uniref:Uncharacterized protein LOC114850102 n=1 Tax=Betta splendens TaxID=158456 RepID=A0A6P7LVD2_BETSP|nr:uncharacterized protein LOC114850102 [Betta splendens]